MMRRGGTPRWVRLRAGPCMSQQSHSLQTLDVIRPVVVSIVGDWGSETEGKVAALIRGNQGSDGFMEQNLTPKECSFSPCLTANAWMHVI